MVKRVGGNRRKTRNKLKQAIRNKGKISISRYFQVLQPGEKVVLHMNPAVQKGAYFPRFHGRVATVQQKRGECYELFFKDGNKKKMAVVHPIHLKKLEA